MTTTTTITVTVWVATAACAVELVGGHCHDAADQIDHVMEASDAGRRALVIGLVELAATAVI